MELDGIFDLANEISAGYITPGNKFQIWIHHHGYTYSYMYKKNIQSLFYLNLFCSIDFWHFTGYVLDIREFLDE